VLASRGPVVVPVIVAAGVTAVIV